LVTSVVVEQPLRSDVRARSSFQTARKLETESGEVGSQMTTAGMSDTALPILLRAKPWITGNPEVALISVGAGAWPKPENDSWR
jgi:hypothetical protein